MKETGEPLPGAAIVIKGTGIGTVVDKEGKFKLEDPNPKVNANGELSSTLVVSFVGFKTVEKTFGISGRNIKNKKVIDVAFNMEDAIYTISNNSYDGDYKTTYNGERLAPPPPPPPPTNEAVPANEKTSPPLPEKHNGEEVFYIVEDMPHFQGGYYAMQDYISKMQQKIAQEKGIKGKAKVLFTVNAKGIVSDIKIVEKDNDAAGKGAVMIASEMPDWTPGKQRGKAVPVKYLLPVEFK